LLIATSSYSAKLYP